jgi:cytochrome d ubiquinol oxidase subunit I
MQTPQGHAIIDGRVVPVDWLKVIFNPSFPYRLVHMVIAAFLATALLVAAGAAWQLLRGRDNLPVRRMLSMAMWMLLAVAPLQAFVGDLHGLNTLEHQPAKIAAIEGHWENKPGEGVALILFGLPDMEAETTRYALALPNMGSLLLTRTLDGHFPGLKEFPKQDRPNSTVVFWSFRAMVGLGVLMILLAVLGTWLRVGSRLYSSRPFLKFALAMGPAGLVAILAGWITTEVGRQPWLVYGVMRTADGVSRHPASQVGFTLALFVAVYLVVFGAGTVYLLRIIGKGPKVEESQHPPEGGPGQMRQPMRPLSGATEDLEPDAAARRGED